MGGLTWRPATVDDAVAYAELLAEAEKVDDTGEHYSAEDIVEEFADPALDPTQDTMAGFDGTRMVAFAEVRARTSPVDVHKIFLHSTVHPDYRDQGVDSRLLLDWQTERALAVHAARHPELPGEIMGHVYEQDAATHQVYRASGFEPVRWFFDMTADLTAPLPEAGVLPEGLRMAPYQTADSDRVRLAHNEAFQDHWGAMPVDEPTWAQWFAGSRAARPALSFLAMAEDEIAGYVLGYEYEAESEVNGYRTAEAGQVGTRRAWRRTGVACALLCEFLAVAQESGYTRAKLIVDSANPTGALGLYQRHGFAKARCYARYLREC